jgi:hypothetical protein
VFYHVNHETVTSHPFSSSAVVLLAIWNSLFVLSTVGHQILAPASSKRWPVRFHAMSCDQIRSVRNYATMVRCLVAKDVWEHH